jgi:hypothetical protein
MELPGSSHDDTAHDLCNLRGEQPRRHRDDLRDLRVVRHPHRATKREYIVAGSSQGAAATTTSRQPARRASPAPSDQTRAHCGGHEERAELPGSSRHDDIAATCAIGASCVPRAERRNAGTSRRAQRKRGAPREQPSRRHRGDLRDLRVVRHPHRATKREYIVAGSSQGAAATTTSRRPACRALPTPTKHKQTCAQELPLLLLCSLVSYLYATFLYVL